MISIVCLSISAVCLMIAKSLGDIPKYFQGTKQQVDYEGENYLDSEINLETNRPNLRLLKGGKP